MYFTIMTGSYLILLVAGTLFMVYLTIRSNRTAFYYALFWYGAGLLSWICIRLLESFSSDLSWIRIYYILGIVHAALMIPLLINLLYAFFMHKLMPFVLQMMGGAVALSLVLFVWPYVYIIEEQYMSNSLDLFFLLYLWMPAIIFVFSVPLVSLAIKNCYINISSLSIERIFASSPDLYFFIDRNNWLTDHNAPSELYGDCHDRSDLIVKLESVISADQQENWIMLRKSLLLPKKEDCSGEIKMIVDGKEFWYFWTVKPVQKQNGRVLGSFLLLSDRTAVKQYMIILNRQNEELQKVNSSLSDYESLVYKYTEMSTRQEVSNYIDISVRNRLLQSFDQIENFKLQNESGISNSSKLAIEYLRAECRRSLTDIRALVKRLSQ